MDKARTFELLQGQDSIIRKFSGEVEMRQDSIFMYCDTATIFNDTRVVAIGNVLIQQGDSVSVFADSLRYESLSRIANLYGNVILKTGERELFTDSLRYDLRSKLATYNSGAVLINGPTQLSSTRGYYFVESNQAFFRDSVIVIDSLYSLRADTLGFNTETGVVSFLGPTLINSDSSRVYCEAGFYDTPNNKAEFRENAQFVKGEQKARAETIFYDGSTDTYSLIGNARFVEGDRKAQADTIRYDESNDKTFLMGNARYSDLEQEIVANEIIYDAENDVYSTRGRSRISDPPQILEADMIDFSEITGLGLAEGNVIWRDTSANLTIKCEYADYDQATEYLKASGGYLGRPLLITEADGDSLFLTADTLVAIRADTLTIDSSRLLLAYNDVRAFKSDLQALCDSLVLDTRDSIFHFYQQPIIWSENSQFTADTIDMTLKDGSVDRIFLVSEALIVSTSDERFYDQIRGKNITAYFADGKVDRMQVVGNAESIYYAKDEAGAYVGANKTICSEMIIYWGEDQVETIRFLAQPKGDAYPMGQVDHNTILRLKGFRWVKPPRRPTSLEDLFTPRSAPPPSPPPAPEGQEKPPATGPRQE